MCDKKRVVLNSPMFLLVITCTLFLLLRDSSNRIKILMEAFFTKCNFNPLLTFMLNITMKYYSNDYDVTILRNCDVRKRALHK